MKAPAKPALRSISSDRYLQVILLLTDHGDLAETNAIAAQVGVSAAATSRMLKTLAKRKLVDLEPYQGARLTSDGLHRALRVLRRSRLVEVFLHTVLGFEVHELRHRSALMVDAIDEVFEERLDRLLESPRVCPHGQPIPSKNVTWPKLGDASLTSLPIGSTGLVSRVTSDDFAVHTFLREHGIKPGVTVLLEGVAPFDGPITLRIGSRPCHLGPSIAKLIFVEQVPTTEQTQPDAIPRPRRRHG